MTATSAHNSELDPAMIEQLEKVIRIGNVYITRGEIKDPKAWASSMNNAIRKHIKDEKNPDWNTIIKRLKQTTKIRDWNTTPFVYLGNAYLKIGEKAEALIAFKKGFDNLEKGDPYEQSMLDHIAKVENSDDVTQMESLRPMNVE